MSEKLTLSEDSEFILNHPILREMHDSIARLQERVQQLETTISEIREIYHMY